jgi:acetylornithine/succinyldiaminopimelate/putrescine aminotransferase
MPFVPVTHSLTDLVGSDYVEAVCRARALLTGADAAALRRAADEPVEFWPESLQQRLHELLPRTGEIVVPPWTASPAGAGTEAFRHAARKGAAPLTGLGYFRVGEDGRLYVISKSEHYHAPLGHAFPGYAIVDVARSLGIPNATHNNTRGAITRRLEEELVRAANGLSSGDDLECLLHADDPAALNRVLNLETGSLAAEAALKLALRRFYRHLPGEAEPLYGNRTPVLLVLGDDAGTPTGNYHGTTIFTQAMRGLWPELRTRLEDASVMRVAAVRPNLIADLEEAFRKFETPPYKIAAFLHEIIMMNYGARRLSEEFLHRAYALCAVHDVPAIADEIQSCMWYEGMFLFRQYGLKPSMVAVGKGFPGGEYPASRLLFSSCFDALPQFGALVTNGQEELASLAYLVTMKWAAGNGPAITAIGRRLEEAFAGLARDFPRQIAGVEGRGHLLGLRFHDLACGRAAVEAMTRMGFDISLQTYKADCPPVALTKLPIIADEALVDFLADRLRRVLG